MRLPDELVKAAFNNNLVIWIGAGLSFNFKNQKGKPIGGWANMANHITDSFSQERYLTSMLMYSVRNRGDSPIEILDIFEVLSYLPKSEVRNYVKSFYSVPDDDREWLDENLKKQVITKDECKKLLKDFYTLSEKQEDWSLHEDLSKLSNIIITTNYDNAFEITSSRINRPLKTILINDTIEPQEIQEINDLQKTTLIKLHGSISDEATMVIFPEDYAYLYEHCAHSLISELKKIIFAKNILFIGCGMSDWQINNIFKFAKNKLADLNQKHFIIEEENRYNNIKKEVEDFLELIPIKEYNPDINNIIKELLREKSVSIKIIELDFCKQANKIFNEAILLKKESLWEQCCKLYKKAAESLNSRNEETFYKWGIALWELAKLRKSEILYKESLEKFDIITSGLNPYREEVFLYKKNVRGELEKLDIEDIIESKEPKFKNLIPVKICVRNTNVNSKIDLNFCGCINSCKSTACKRCGGLLGEEWSDGGHISAGVCEKCGKYAIIGDACPTCGCKVPYFYEDFIN
ncbi:MAG: SIR2 family protein [Tannerellaceae bacterium]|jgi:hypothetical protein|nr:SIR2 family protein [Tannerellaceae bacterium]